MTVESSGLSGNLDVRLFFGLGLLRFLRCGNLNDLCPSIVLALWISKLLEGDPEGNC
jgi:hypothetical protein